MAADSVERTYSITQARVVSAGANDLPKLNGTFPRSIYLSTSGDVTGILSEDTSAVTQTAMAAGMWHPCSLKVISACPANTLVGW